MNKDRTLIVRILAVGFPTRLAEHLADEILVECQAFDDPESAAFALAGLHLKCGGDFAPALRLVAA